MTESIEAKVERLMCMHGNAINNMRGLHQADSKRWSQKLEAALRTELAAVQGEPVGVVTEDGDVKWMNKAPSDFEPGTTLYTTPQPATSAKPEPMSGRAAYEGMRESMLHWQRRALDAEATEKQLVRALREAVEQPTFMGEPVAEGDAKDAQSSRENVYESLLKACVRQLKAWHSKYGANAPSWLPPGGDVKLMETIDDWLATSAQQSAVETKIYSDGTTATGLPPLPDVSPASQVVMQAVLSCRYSVCTSISKSGYGWDTSRLNEVVSDLEASQEGDAKDAERYRFLEYQCRTGTYRGIISRKAIDEAMAAIASQKATQ